MSQPCFLMPESVPVHDLGTNSHEAIWLGRPAAETLRTEVRRAGLAEGAGSGPDVVSLSPGAVATAEAIAGFVAASQQVEGDVVGTLAEPIAPWGTWSAFGPPALLTRMRGGGEVSPERISRAHRVEVPVTELRTVPVPLADQPGGRVVEVQLADELLISTHHYSGLLWANLLAMPPALWRALMGTSTWMAAARGVWGMLLTRSSDPVVVAGALNRIDPGARVHPSAVVEGAWIGADAVVGPGAVVRGSIIGEGARVEPMALVAWSVLGPGSHVQRMAWCHFCVLHPGAAHAGAMQLGVLGPGAQTKGVSVLMDQGAGTEVRVQRQGELHAVPLGLMGVGLGRDSVVGSGVWVAPGRAIPPGLTILPSRDTVVMRIPDGLTGVVRASGGTLEPAS